MHQGRVTHLGPGNAMHHASVMHWVPGTPMHHAAVMQRGPGATMHQAVLVHGGPGAPTHQAAVMLRSPGRALAFIARAWESSTSWFRPSMGALCLGTPIYGLAFFSLLTFSMSLWHDLVCEDIFGPSVYAKSRGRPELLPFLQNSGH